MRFTRKGVNFMFIINLYELTNKNLIWGHENARNYRNIILKKWNESMDDVLVMDFKQITMIDFSAASDLICIPISRLQADLIGKHIIISNAENEVRENINVALDRQELFCINLLEQDTYEILGKCSNGLKDIFKVLYEKKKADSRTLADILNTTVQVINNRTTTLYKLGLLKRRMEDAPTGGKQYIYESII